MAGLVASGSSELSMSSDVPRAVACKSDRSVRSATKAPRARPLLAVTSCALCRPVTGLSSVVWSLTLFPVQHVGKVFATLYTAVKNRDRDVATCVRGGRGVRSAMADAQLSRAAVHGLDHLVTRRLRYVQTIIITTISP